MHCSSQALRAAARDGDYGRVVRLARIASGLTQRQLGEACATTQSAVSRLEAHGTAPYTMTTLARAATYLNLPAHLVGLAERCDQNGPVQRRDFLAGAAAVAVSPAVQQRAEAASVTGGTGQAEALRSATHAFRRMEGSTPSRQLQKTVLAQLDLARSLAGDAGDAVERASLAAAGSETASLAGWLAWDMGDHGSARTWYGSAVKAARRSGNPLLTAYQVGSLAQFEAQHGSPGHSRSLISTVRRQLGAARPAIAEAWLSGIEALAHAAAGDARQAERALRHSSETAGRIGREEPPPWPWVFRFDETKIATCRMACGARLGLSTWVFDGQEAAEAALTSGHAKQRALLLLDVATGHLAQGRVETAFVLATHAVDSGLMLRSERVVNRAHAFRRGHGCDAPPKVVREFDDRLLALYA